MPKLTFFNLPEKKKQLLIQAAKNEFSRASLAEASIANIVKEAKIPRGSFYQYFEDKEDLYLYLLNEDAEERKKTLITALRKWDGDIFEAMSEMFHQLLKEIDNENTRQFYRNVFLNLNYRTEKTILDSINYSELDKQYFEMRPLVNTINLNVANDEELYEVIQILSVIVVNNLVIKFAKELSNEEVEQKFSTHIKLLKEGFLKK